MPNQARQYDALWREIQPCVRCREHPILGPKLASANVFIPLPPLRPQPSLDLPVRFLLVGAEPSDKWRSEVRTEQAKSPTSNRDALRRIKAGYRNYTGNLRTIALDFAARTWLIDEASEAFAITDLAKCAMDRTLANHTDERYATCAPWLLREIDLMKPRALIAIGARSLSHLQDLKVPLPVFDVPHFSRLAVGHWSDEIPPHPRGIPIEAFESYARRTLNEYHRADEPVTASQSIVRLLALYRKKFKQIRHAAASF